MSPIRHTLHHARFYLALASGLLCWLLLEQLHSPVAAIAAGDVFFALYLIMSLAFVSRASVAGLRQHASEEDEGPWVIIGITVAAVILSMVSIFSLLGGKPGALHLSLALASVPLGWLCLHTVLAFHYARLYYGSAQSDGEGQEQSKGDDAGGDNGGLEFPGTKEPDAWDFLYFSFVLGMTAQVSDVPISSASLRRVVLVHSVASFFFNTVLVALAVNVAVNAS